MTTSDLTEPELIQRAVTGDRDSLSALVETARARILPYFCRVLLDEDRAQELTQESLTSMVASVGTLKHVDRFWPWVFRIASNQLRQYFRSRGRHKMVSMSAIQDAGTEPAAVEQEELLTDMSRRELAQLTREAMSELSDRHRMVLALRFYEDMPHAEVARVLGCTELVARMLFFRAKGALLQRLRRRGIHDASMLAALAAFGQLTASSTAQAAALSMNTAVLGESMLTGLLPAKAKIAAGLGALLIGASLWWAFSAAPSSSTASAEVRPPVRTLHFTQQSLVAESKEQKWAFRSKGAYEEWYHFPEGLNGPFLRRMQRWDPLQKSKLCWWVQTEDANYYVYSGDGTVYLNNARLYSSSMQVRLLPTDPANFCAFVTEVDKPPTSPATAPAQGFVDERDPETGYLRKRVDKRFTDIPPFESIYEYSSAPPDAALFTAPTGPKIVDERDAMHRRGWTYFHVQGEISGHKVTGRGRMPFTYRAAKDRPAWLNLQIDGIGQLCDGATGTFAMDPAGAVTATYPLGTLFKGLPRPWIGFHTLDTVRRDAAHERLGFDIEVIEAHKKAEITVLDTHSSPQRMACYQIDVENDLLTQVQYWSDPDAIFAQPTAHLKFEYLQEIGDAETEFTPLPLPDAARATPAKCPGPFWPLLLTGEAGQPAKG